LGAKNFHGVVEVHTVFGTTPQTGKIAPLPDWGTKDLKLGTLRAVIRQLGLDWQDFLNAK
jgi:hypothetical protein